MSYEYILLKKDNVNLFKLPTNNISKEIYLNGWKEQIWRGNLIVKAKENDCWLELYSLNNNLYAKTMPKKDFRDKIQKCVDSSRGFAIKLEDGKGKSAWVGLLFHDRNDAFDLYAIFDDFEKKMEQESKISTNKFDLDIDLSLKPGEKISLGLANNDNNLKENNNDFSNFTIGNPDSGKKPVIEEKQNKEEDFDILNMDISNNNNDKIENDFLNF